MNIINGDLIALALEGKFDIISQGVNCFWVQKRGLAVQMVENFQTNNPKRFPLEGEGIGDYNKLGQIELCHFNDTLDVVNCYTQYHWREPSKYGTPLDYDALRLCLRKLNFLFFDRKVGLPLIGGGLAGGDKEKIIQIMEEEIPSATLVLYVS